MGRPSGTTRPQAQAQRSTSQTSRAPDLSAEPETIQTSEKRKNKKSRPAQRRAEQAANGETTDSELANLTPEMDTMEVAASDNEHIPKNRKRNRIPATVQEEEHAAPAQTPRSHQRSQSSASPEDTTYFGPQNQTEQDAAPTSPGNDAAERGTGTRTDLEAPKQSGTRRFLAASAGRY
jgi:hypothetical protein